MTIAPPTIAERLLRWSLPDADRDVVLGDLQEEFGALIEAEGTAPAERWYWQQTVLSVGPNLARRVRLRFDERRRFETAEDRRARMKARKWGLIMTVVGVPGVVLSVLRDEAIPAVLAFFFVLFGVAAFFGSFFARTSEDEFSRGIARRRNSLYWATYAGAAWLQHIFGETPFVHYVRLSALLFGASLLLWPKKYWVFGSDVPYREPEVWTPFTGTGRRAPDGSFRLTVDAPRAGVTLGDPIVVRAGDTRIGINRVYSSNDSLRVFAVVGEGAEPPNVTLDVLDQSGVVQTSSRARLQSVDLVPEKAPTRRTLIPLAQIDEVVSLSGLPPGKYQLHLTIADSERRSEKFAEFRIATP